MLIPVTLEYVQLADAFWAPRLTVNRERTLPHNMDWCVRTGRVANFEKVVAGATSGHQGFFFNDSDVYKVIEGAAYHLAVARDPELEKQLDAWIETIAAVQRPDGYLNTYFQLNPQLTPWTQDQFHELYCAGTIFEAGVAYHRATGKSRLLEVARRVADHVDATFGPGRKAMAPEHPEIELALVKLADHTHEPRYLRLAQFFVEQRGRHEGRTSWKEYAQDHRPIREQTAVVGHAVRAFYLYAAVTDLAGATGDEGYRTALDRLWNDLLARKLYVTGGTGVWADEGFAAAYELPNERAYAETCASIALAFWSQRLALLHADARYADMLEQLIYNAIPAAVSLDGEKYFYANPLTSRGPGAFEPSGGPEGGSTSHRQHWFRCACCPPSVLRFVAQLPGYVYATGPQALYVNLYLAGRAQAAVDGRPVRIEQRGQYPWDGRIELRLEPQETGEFDLYLRVPAWVREARFEVNGRAIAAPERVRGYARLRQTWKAGDTVTLELPMPIERIECDPRVKENAGRVALRRGPVIYCAEEADHPGGVLSLAVPADAQLTAEHRPDLLGGVTVLTGAGVRRGADAWPGLYRPQSAKAPATTPMRITAVPYAVWDNRAPGEMVVWLPQSAALAEPGR